MKGVPGVADLAVLVDLGEPNLLIQVDRKRAARYGVLPGDVNGVVQATIGGQAVTQVLDGERRFDVVVRFLPQYRGTVDAISSIPVNTPNGAPVPLRDVANITKQTGASYIYREDNGRYIPIKFSVRGRDLQSTIAEAEAKIKKVVKLPAGYHFEWAGQFQELQDAVKRLEIVVPISILLIFALLYGNFRDLRDSLLVLGAAPPALVGGILALLITGTTFSISAAVGFISLFGVSMLNGVVLVSYIKELREKGASLSEAVYRGSELRLRPVLMASLAAAIGLLPASMASGIGSETQKALARVVVGGMITAPVLLLLVVPALYKLVHGHARRRASSRDRVVAQATSPVSGD